MISFWPMFLLQAADSGLASYVAGQIDRTLSWKVIWLPYRIYGHKLQREKLVQLQNLFQSLIICEHTCYICKESLCILKIACLNNDRMWSGSKQLPQCLSWWRVSSQLKIVRTRNFDFSLHLLRRIQILMDYWHAARIAIQNGAAGIIVSNHGARQLDYVPSTIMALEEVCLLQCLES